MWHTDGPISGAIFQEYQHPEYLRTGRYRAAYDYYSLGLVLLEIGVWMSLQVGVGFLRVFGSTYMYGVLSIPKLVNHKILADASAV